MSNPVAKKKKHTRKAKKIYQYVKFESSLFDGEFTLPKPQHMTQKVAVAIDEGRFSELYDFFRGAGVDEADIEAFSELDAEETGTFMEEWGNGDPVSAPK